MVYKGDPLYADSDADNYSDSDFSDDYYETTDDEEESLLKQKDNQEENPDSESWKNNARNEQREVYQRLGQQYWREYREADHKYIVPMLLSLFGTPDQKQLEADGKKDTADTARVLKEKTRICEKIKKTIIDLSGGKDVYMAVIFFVCHFEGKTWNVPVYRIWIKAKHEIRFVDNECRVYKDFAEFLETNKIPKCTYCYPKYGYYSSDLKDVYEYDADGEPTLDFADSPSVWEPRARKQQLEFYQTLGQPFWDEYKEADHIHIVPTLLFSLFGPPDQRQLEIDEKDKADNPGYSKEQKRICEKIKKKIIILSGGKDVYMAVIFFVCHFDGKTWNVPVHRIWLKGEDKIHFVDNGCRVYEDFADFLKNNKIAKCMYCYPKYGYYSRTYICTIKKESRHWNLVTLHHIGNQVPGKQQCYFYQELGQSLYDEYKEADHQYIIPKLLFSLYGPPDKDQLALEEKTENEDKTEEQHKQDIPKEPQVNPIDAADEKLNEEKQDAKEKDISDTAGYSKVQYGSCEKTKMTTKTNSSDAAEKDDKSNKKKQDAKEKEISDTAGYAKEQKETCEKIKKTIIDISGGKDVYMAVIFFVCHSDDGTWTVPVYRIWIKTEEETTFTFETSQTRFVDRECRVYKDFAHFLKTNTIPKCSYCYPKYGYYSCSEKDAYMYKPNGEPTVDFGDSPSSGFLSQTGNVLDIAGSVTGLVASGILITSLFTPVGWLLGGAATVGGFGTGIYTAGRSTAKLQDRGSHGQSIAPTNKESITSWLSIAGASLGMGAAVGARAAASAAQAGSTMNAGTRALVTFVNVGAVGVSGFGVGYGAYDMYDKKKRAELTPLDVLQFSMSLFFFGHSVVNFRTASTIIKEEQNAYLRETRKNLSSRSAKTGLKKFSRINYENGGEGQMNKNANVIRQLNKIDNPDQFFKGLPQTLKTVNTNGKNAVSFNDGLLRLNKELDIDPNVFNKMSAGEQAKLIKTTNDYSTGRTNYEQFSKNIAGMEKHHQLVLNTKKDAFVQNLAKSFGATELSGVSVGGKRIFADMKSGDMNRLCRVCSGTSDNFDPKMMSTVGVFAEEHGCTSLNQFAGYIEFVKKHINSTCKTKSERAEYSQKLQNPKSAESAELRNNYTSMRSEINAVHAKSPLKFDSDISATYHHYKHCKHNGETISPDQYFNEFPSILFTAENEVKSTTSQDGAQTIRTFFNKASKLYGTLIEKTVSGQLEQNIGTMFYRPKYCPHQ